MLKEERRETYFVRLTRHGKQPLLNLTIPQSKFPPTRFFWKESGRRQVRQQRQMVNPFQPNPVISLPDPVLLAALVPDGSPRCAVTSITEEDASAAVVTLLVSSPRFQECRQWYSGKPLPLSACSEHEVSLAESLVSASPLALGCGVGINADRMVSSLSTPWLSLATILEY